MNTESSLLLFGLAVIAAIVALALWHLWATTRPRDKGREEREARRISRQPWDADSSDGRGNR